MSNLLETFGFTRTMEKLRNLSQYKDELGPFTKSEHALRYSFHTAIRNREKQHDKVTVANVFYLSDTCIEIGII
jgi:hypothetical protein